MNNKDVFLVINKRVIMLRFGSWFSAYISFSKVKKREPCRQKHAKQTQM